MDAIGNVNSASEHVVEWLILNFSSLPEQDVIWYHSPIFLFNGASWYLRISPNVVNKGDAVGYVNLSLKRKTFGLQIGLDFSLSLKDVAGKKVKEMHFTKIFLDEFQGYHIPCFISRSELTARKEELLPADVLTVICILKYPASIASGSESNVSVLHQHLKKLFLEQDNCDVVFKVQEQEFRAHKAIVTARSPVFAATFRHYMKEKKTGIVTITDCDPSIFSDFLRFLYCEDLENLSEYNVFGLFTVADKYDVTDLCTKCIKFMTEFLTIDTFCETYQLAVRHDKAKLINLCREFFVKNAREILETDSWKYFQGQNPTESNKLFIKFVASANNSNI